MIFRKESDLQTEGLADPFFSNAVKTLTNHHHSLFVSLHKSVTQTDHNNHKSVRSPGLDYSVLCVSLVGQI